jgi:heavy metal efflux system protein
LLLTLLVLKMHGTEIERPLAIMMIGGLVTSTLFTLLALPTFYLFMHELGEWWRRPSVVVRVTAAADGWLDPRSV